MGKVFYNNWLAKSILFQGYGTIMFLGMILTKVKEGRLSEKTINHETIHQYQYCECLLIGAVISTIIILLTHISLWNQWWFYLCWAIFILAFYYILYLVEWLASIIYHLIKPGGSLADDNHDAYKASAMEMEAKANENNLNYLKERGIFTFKFFSYYGTV